jgi:hypothetical protein
MTHLNGNMHRDCAPVPLGFLRWIVAQGILEVASEDEMNALGTLFVPEYPRGRNETADDFRERLRAVGSELLSKNKMQ